MRKLCGAVVTAGLLGVFSPATASAIPFYADSVVVQNVTPFGSGLLTGSPDSGGAFLSNTSDPPTLLGSITAQFLAGIVNGAGADIVIYDCCDVSGLPGAAETANVFVSNNGVAFTLLGGYGNGVNSFDLNGIFAQTVNFVRIVNTSQSNSPDIDAFQGNYAATAVPEPATLLLLGTGLAMMARRKATNRR